MKIAAQEIKRKHQRPGRISSGRKKRKLAALKPNVNLDKTHDKPHVPPISRPPPHKAAAKAGRKASEPGVALKPHRAPPVSSPQLSVPESGPKPVATGQAHAPPIPLHHPVKPKRAEQPVPTPVLTEKRSEPAPCDERECPKRVGQTSPKTTSRKVSNPSRSKKDDDPNTPVKFDPLQRYLSEISKYRLLTRDEERDYGIRVVERGDKDAAYILVTANLRLVVKIAFQFQRMWMQNLLDLIQEGNIGLMQAVQKFDPYKNVKFSYYASFWIKAYILKFIMDNWRLVKIGTTQGQRKLFFKLKKEKQHLIDQGFDPHPKLLAARMGVSEREVVEMDQRLDGWDVSLDAPLKDDSKTERIEFLESDAETVEEQVTQKQLKLLLNNKISAFQRMISPREVHILESRFLSEEHVTLEVIGEQYGISRERVRQIEAVIIRKMRDFFKREIPDFATCTGQTAAEK